MPYFVVLSVVMINVVAPLRITTICHDAECCVLFIVMLNDILMNAVMLSVTGPISYLFKSQPPVMEKISTIWSPV